MRVDARAVEVVPGDGDVAIVGEPDDLLWLFRADATGTEIAAGVAAICAQIGPSYSARLSA